MICNIHGRNKFIDMFQFRKQKECVEYSKQPPTVNTAYTEKDTNQPPYN